MKRPFLLVRVCLCTQAKCNIKYIRTTLVPTISLQLAASFIANGLWVVGLLMLPAVYIFWLILSRGIKEGYEKFIEAYLLSFSRTICFTVLPARPCIHMSPLQIHGTPVGGYRKSCSPWCFYLVRRTSHHPVVSWFFRRIDRF